MNYRFEYGKYYKHTTLARDIHDDTILYDMKSEMAAKQEATRIVLADKELGGHLRYHLKKYGAGERYKWTETIEGNLYREVWLWNSGYYKDVVGGFSIYLKLTPMEANDE